MDTTIVESNRLDASYNVVFYRPDRMVYVRAGLNPVTQTCAITHELGHIHYAHDCSTQQAEHKADEWAANHLLHEAAVQHTGYETEFEPAATATELGVTRTHIKILAVLLGWSHHIPILTTKPRPRDRIFI